MALASEAVRYVLFAVGGYGAGATPYWVISRSLVQEVRTVQKNVSVVSDSIATMSRSINIMYTDISVWFDSIPRHMDPEHPFE